MAAFLKVLPSALTFFLLPALYFKLSLAAHQDTIALCYKVIGDASQSIPVFDRTTIPNGYDIDTGDCLRGYKPASGTVYISWPDAGTEECEDFEGCKYAGQFSQVNGGSLPTCRPPARPLEQPNGGNLQCRFPKQVVRSWKVAATWERRKDLLNKKVHVFLSKKAGGREIGTFNIVDTCSDADCSGCCSSNTANGKYPLIDMEITGYCQKLPCPVDIDNLPHPPNDRPT